MQELLPYGDAWLDVELPGSVSVTPSGFSLPLPPVRDVEAAIAEALQSPLDTPPLSQLVKPGDRVLVAFDDPTVPCYHPLWATALPRILAALEAGGVDRKHVTLVCANALHRQFTHDELARLIGDDLVAEFGNRLFCHDAEDPEQLVEIGTTPNGYTVDINKLVVDSDLVVYLNCSTTRGFSGGWKSICVGLSSYRSIAYHHTPDAMSMSFDRNPMHTILDEMGTLMLQELGERRFFKIETVLANPVEIAAIFGGTVDGTRRAAVELNRQHMVPRRDLLEERADVVLYGVPDWSPYAAYSYTNPILSMISTGLGYLGGMIEAIGKPGCTVVMATPCPDRWDHEHHPSYKEVWDRVLPETTDPYRAREMFEVEFATRSDYIDRYRNGYGFHGVHGIMALYPLKRLKHASRVIVAGAEDPAVPHRAGFDSAVDVEGALAEAIGEHGPGSRIALVRYPMAISRQ